MHTSKWLFITILFFLAGLTSAQAERLTRQTVPTPLQPWVDWVLQDQKEQSCPFLYNNGSKHRCAWPTQLELDLYNHGGEFSITWQVYRESWITLPGNSENWPVAVTDNDLPLIIISRKGRPTALVPAGTHRIKGRFEWRNLPENLAIPPDSGLVTLSVMSRSIPSPLIDKGQIWIKKQQPANTDDRKQVVLKVYRNIVDEIPALLTTQIDLQVSGKQRELVIGKPLLSSSIPININSQLPARLEPDGRLRVQVRPGRWKIEVFSRLPEAMSQLVMNPQEAPWPDSEIWTFSARNHLRLVEVEGAPGIDPRQTQMPRQWREFPAYRLKAGGSLSFKIIRRGDPEPEPNQLSLSRDLWLDQNGQGFTISDKITGRMTQTWRLEASDQLHLGRVLLDGKPQFITRNADSDQIDSIQMGIEVRRGDLSLTADSRHETDVADFNAVGWDEDFHKVSANLHLPPGWELFSASGIDTVPNTWLQRWTLLDLFLVLIISIAGSRLWNWQTGILSLCTLILLWHEPGAPRLIWLHLIAAIALLKVLPAGKFSRLVSAYRNITLLILVLISIPFMIEQIRLGLFPQLERPWLQAGQNVNRFDSEVSPAAPSSVGVDADQVEEMIAQPAKMSKTNVKKSRSIKPESKSSSSYNRSRLSAQYDTESRIQTGPGLPQWQWKTIPMSWNGPVEKEQRIHLTLLTPTMNLGLNILRILLLAAFFVFISGIKSGGLPIKNFANKKQAAVAMPLLFIPLLLTSYPTQVQADIPTPEILEQLRQRLTVPPECLPQCARLERMKLEITPNHITIRSLVHSIENVMIPLPGSANKDKNLWMPLSVVVNGEPARALHRDKNGTLWVEIGKGTHQLILLGELPNRNHVDLVLPLKPPRVKLQTEGWNVIGLDDNGRPDNQLQLTRLEDNNGIPSKKLETGGLPGFVKIHRTLRLGLDWSMETRIERVSTGAAIVLKVPLINGELVLSNNMRVKNGHVLLNMSPQQSTVSWRSSLKISPELTLSASQTTAWTEIWYADVSPVWHLESAGIAAVHHQNPQGQWLPEWRPWPGESVTLQIGRPEGVPGQTLTIDSSRLSITPGKRATDAILKLSLRSSQGGQHTLTLPEQTRLQSVTIDGKLQPIRLEGTDNRQVTLPVHPGMQTIKLGWRHPTGHQGLLKTPEIDLGTSSVNHILNINLNRDRWVLLSGGPQWGPAVLFWGLLVVIVLVAAGLGRITLTPLKTRHWILLGIGLSQAPIYAAMLVVAWLLALGAREKLVTENPASLTKTRFNLIQIGLGLLTLIALLSLFEAIRQGLLGSPDMQVAGNQSTAYNLNWYQDRIDSRPEQAWVLSVPLLVYRLLMLAWSLWLAFALVRWLRWGWECFSKEGIWQNFQLRAKPAAYEPGHASEQNGNPAKKK